MEEQAFMNAKLENKATLDKAEEELNQWANEYLHAHGVLPTSVVREKFYELIGMKNLNDPFEIKWEES